MTRLSAICWLALVVVVAAACAPEPSPTSSQATVQSAPKPTRALNVSIRTEPPTLAQKVLSSGVGTSFAFTQRAFNATLGLYDGQGLPQPYLAEALPQLDTDTWKTLPDGTMETTHRLKPNLTWHDGEPLTAEDFVFAWQVYSSPQVGIANVVPQSLIADVSAPDPRTVLIHWSGPYPKADVLPEDNLPPLPRHLLASAFERDPGGLATLPFWTTDYVSAGPFKLARWEPGASIEGSAFDGHALGKPKIDRIRIVFISDSNVALANLLSGDVDFATDSSIRFAEGQILQQQWGPQNGGTVLMRPGSYRGVFVQLRPDVASPRALLDVRVRRALAHGIDRVALNNGLFDGQGVMSDVPFISPRTSFYAEVDRAVAKYPRDPRASERLMSEAGFTKGGDGVFASAADGTLHFELNTLAGPYRDAEIATLASGWREIGFDFKESFMLPALAADNQARATFPSLFSYSTGAGEYSLASFTTSRIGTPDNRWIGPNRPGWSDPDFDRLSAAFASTIAPRERVALIAQMAKVMSEQLPTIPLMFELAAYAHNASVHGPNVDADEAVIGWNVQDWVLD
ncbi:MAG TPA: peptide ABC transporter substrate-binding protein [Chloroflexota bacterium]|nr:peptide ABC transporter substrate-binding protein [Chloroflexota bacterium]